MTQDDCWPCDAAPLRFYIYGLMADCTGLGYILGYAFCKALQDVGYL